MSNIRCLKFIDLFAGLGGFHLALTQLGHECVFACEKDGDLRTLYKQNFGLEPAPDIRALKPGTIPAHDILCAGFPCQPFSKAGEQEGFACPENGDLFDYVARIVRHHQPSFVILENVPNLKSHNGGNTYERLEARLRKAGYEVQEQRLSPHQFGIPQIRERIFIVAAKAGLSGFSWPQPDPERESTIDSVLDSSPPEARPLPSHVQKCLDVWQEFLNAFPRDIDLPSFPLWSMEWGATYPYQVTTPHSLGVAKLRRFRGAHGATLAGLADKEVLAALPAYARTKQAEFPSWKVRFIAQNRAFYEQHRDWLDKWIPKILPFAPSRQKLEWNIKGGEREIRQYVLQLRASGVRVKRRTTAPSLVAMTTTQVPIIPWENRYMTPRECARLQSMYTLKYLPRSSTRAYKALGNAVNVEVVRRVAAALLEPPTTSAREGAECSRTVRKNAIRQRVAAAREERR
ncbi:MAG TPA: DNA (cytosine-5-)-methyltransferase [Gemmatimonadaceae bacterium]